MNNTPEIIIGIDPGTRITGFGVILASSSKQIEVIDYGTIKLPEKQPLSERFKILFNAVNLLIDKFKPTSLSVETQYVHKNPQSTLKLGMSRGIVLLCGALKGVQIFEYTPTEAKKSIFGKGLASKDQILKAISLYLNVNIDKEDASDALALAICHARQNRSLLACV